MSKNNKKWMKTIKNNNENKNDIQNDTSNVIVGDKQPINNKENIRFDKSKNNSKKKVNILIVGNGFNLEFLVDGEKYKDIFPKSSNALREKALDAELLKHVHEDSTDKKHTWDLYGNTMKLKTEPTKEEKKYWNYLSTKREWDAETLASMLLLSRTFQDEDETFGNMLKEGIIKDITSTYEDNKLYNVMWKHEYRKLLLEKLNDYDYIITTNFDNNLAELVRDRSKIIYLTGTIKYPDSIGITPFVSRSEFDSKLIEINKHTKRGYVNFDVFGINMPKQLLLLEFIFSKTNRYTKINHYIYNLSKRQWHEDLFQIVKDFSPAEFAEDPTIGERFKELKSKVYSQIDSSEWIGRSIKNTSFLSAFPTFEELFETLRQSK